VRFLLDHRTQNARHRVGIKSAGIVDANGAIDTHCQRGADLFVDRRRSDRGAHDFRRFRRVRESATLLDGDLVEWLITDLGVETAAPATVASLGSGTLLNGTRIFIDRQALHHNPNIEATILRWISLVPE